MMPAPFKMKLICTKFLRRWHGILNLTRQKPSWYGDRLLEERTEVGEANTFIEKLSETSDIYFTIIRANYDGYAVEELPPMTYHQLPVYAYMLGKFTSRWTFYRTAAYLCDAPQYHLVSEVINPKKDHKLDEVASRHQIDPARFKRISRRLRRVWPLFP